MNKSVTTYIDALKSPQKEICRKLRAIILKTFPEIKEEMKMGVPWYGKYYIVGLKDHVNLGFSVSGLTKKDKDNFEGSGEMMQHKKFFTLKDINEKELVKLLKLVDKQTSSEFCR
ncbi:MAG: DUF1801 domain-containing protein [Candidatus Diapherotrites archaeon]|nr:DUF1801 domain-containing protein [Candidatus Diapherotrites archaeon]